MKVAFFDTKPYDRIWFEPLAKEYGYQFKFYEYKLNLETVELIRNVDAVCAFVNDELDKAVIDRLVEKGVKLIVMRCAGYNNVDIKAAWQKIHVMRVPSYSPSAIAEHTAALLLSLNRKTHRAYLRTRDNNFSIGGLMGFDMKGKAVGVIGTGRIGQEFVSICKGFGMRVFAFDAYPQKDLDVEYVELDVLFEKSDIISLHCPLTKETHHIISHDSIQKMRDGVILLNTSRGGLIDTEALIEGLKSKKVGGAGLDVYEEESDYFFEDFSNEIVEDDDLARLLTFPNVVVTSHQAFFTREAMQQIAIVTMENLRAFETDGDYDNEICYQCTAKNECPRNEGQKRCF